MNVFLLVATNAGAGCFAVTGRLMAVLTLRDTVPPCQRKFCLVMVKAGVLPRCVAMTARTVFTEFTFMDIVFRVTRNACGFELLCVQRARVAFVTRQRDVSASQREFGQLVVIETRLFPVPGVVARVALIAIVTLV